MSHMHLYHSYIAYHSIKYASHDGAVCLSLVNKMSVKYVHRTLILYSLYCSDRPLLYCMGLSDYFAFLKPTLLKEETTHLWRREASKGGVDSPVEGRPVKEGITAEAGRQPWGFSVVYVVVVPKRQV